MYSNLVISAVGDASLHGLWLSGNPKFDLWLIYYGDDEQTAEKYATQCSKFFRKRGQKLHMLGQLLERKMIDLGKYKYVWIPDDDIAITSNGINEMFEKMERYAIMVGQPAVIGYPNHLITAADRLWDFRYTNFVEVMAPCFSQEALRKCSASFAMNESGWGLDYLWWKLIDSECRAMAIFDSTPMIHTRPQQSAKRFDNAHGDLMKIISTYSIQEVQKEFGGMIGKRTIGPKFAHLLNRLFRRIG